MSDRRWRLGQSWAAKDPARSPLVTIVEVGVEPEDERGHRADDILIGCAPRALAGEIVATVNKHPWLAGPVKRAFLGAASAPPRVRLFDWDDA